MTKTALTEYLGLIKKAFREWSAGDSTEKRRLIRNLLSNVAPEQTRGFRRSIFDREDVEELINLQRSGSDAKAYQVRQVRRIIRRYNLELR